MEKQQITLPTKLTIVRLVFSPLFLPVLLAYLLPYNSLHVNGLLSFLFVLLSVTDFFDGYLARRLDQETMLGKFLDPMADKFLFLSVLVGLLAANKIFFYWVIVFIGREFFILGLRIFALEHRISVPVSWRGKIKTAAQMMYVVVAIINPYHHHFFFDAVIFNSLEVFLLAVALLATWWSAYYYYKSFIAAYREL